MISTSDTQNTAKQRKTKKSPLPLIEQRSEESTVNLYDNVRLQFKQQFLTMLWTNLPLPLLKQGSEYKLRCSV